MPETVDAPEVPMEAPAQEAQAQEAQAMMDRSNRASTEGSLRAQRVEWAVGPSLASTGWELPCV